MNWSGLKFELYASSVDNASGYILSSSQKEKIDVAFRVPTYGVYHEFWKRKGKAFFRDSKNSKCLARQMKLSKLLEKIC